MNEEKFETIMCELENSNVDAVVLDQLKQFAKEILNDVRAADKMRELLNHVCFTNNRVTPADDFNVAVFRNTLNRLGYRVYKCRKK